MADQTTFPASHIVCGDWTIPALVAGASAVKLPVTGALGASGDATYGYLTAHTVAGATTQLPTGQVAEVLVPFVQPPIVQSSAGVISYPDFNWWIAVDGNNDQQQYANFDGAYLTNMTPEPQKIAGGADPFAFGVSVRKALSNGTSGPAALAITGVKYTSNIIIKVSSTAGWGASGQLVIQPARVVLLGELYTADILTALMSRGASYNGNFTRNEIRRQIAVTPQIGGQQNGVVSLPSWTSLPGGYMQNSGAQVYRYANYAVNLKATTANTLYALTNSQSAYGGEGQVGQSNDLGYPFGSTNGNPSQVRDAVIVQNFGVAAAAGDGIANIAYAGFKVGSAIVPNGQGFTLDSVINELQYGATPPARAGSGLWFPVPKINAEMSVYGENATPFIEDDGTPVAANAASVAVVGLQLKSLAQPS